MRQYAHAVNIPVNNGIRARNMRSMQGSDNIDYRAILNCDSKNPRGLFPTCEDSCRLGSCAHAPLEHRAEEPGHIPIDSSGFREDHRTRLIPYVVRLSFQGELSEDEPLRQSAPSPILGISFLMAWTAFMAALGAHSIVSSELRRRTWAGSGLRGLGGTSHRSRLKHDAFVMGHPGSDSSVRRRRGCRAMALSKQH